MKAALFLFSLAGALALTVPTPVSAQLSLAALASAQPLGTDNLQAAAVSHRGSGSTLPGTEGYFLSSVSEMFGNSAGSVFVRRSHGVVFPGLGEVNTAFDLNLAYLTGSISEIERTLVAHSAAIADFFNAGRPWNLGAIDFPESSRAGRVSVVVWNLDNGLGSTPTTGWYGALPGPSTPFLSSDIALGGQNFSADVSFAYVKLQDAQVTPIPEPSTYALALGLAALACVSYRRHSLRSAGAGAW